jgi:hypothetical protein
MDWFRKASLDKSLHPVYVAAKLHYDFVRIHPFDDSNGRTSRLLMNYVLLRNGFPPVIIKSVDKKNYLNALNKADVGDFDSFAEYIANELIWSLTKAIKAGLGEEIEDDDDLYKELEVLKRESQNDLNSAIPKSKEVIIELIINSFSKLFQRVSDDQEKFDDFFVDNRISVHFESSNKEVKTIDEFRNFLIEKIRDVNTQMAPLWQNKMSIQFYRSNLKSPPTSLFFSNKSIDIQFLGLTYEVNFQNLKVIKKYPQELSETEIKDLSKAMLKESITEIQGQKKL